MKIVNPEIVAQVEKIISPVYLVGGPVRDLILGKQPTDFDFTTSLLPDEVEAAIRTTGKRPYLMGKRFGTVGVKIGGNLVEITTFRTERYEDGSRRPEVDFVSDITQDLGRRDFTINAMALRDGRLIDPFGGQADLAARCIRAVGKPLERFREDPLRLLRAARFSAQLGFELEAATMQAMQRAAITILQTSKERWVGELDKLLLSPQPSIGLEVLASSRLLAYILPELGLQVGYDQNSPYHRYALWEHTKRVVDGVPAVLNLRWAALLHDVGKPFVRTDKPDRSNYIFHDRVGAELVGKIGHYLHWSNGRTGEVVRLVAEHMSADSPLHAADTGAK